VNRKAMVLLVAVMVVVALGLILLWVGLCPFL